MTLRSLASSLGIAAALWFAADASAQDRAGAAPTQPKQKAAADAKKADGTEAAPDAPAADTAKEKARKAEPKIESATFGGGCFWCLEAFFERINGVKSVTSGYAGGSVARPSYEMVCTGQTGHAEVVHIEYDANIVSYDELLDVFWICHDPTTLNRQGPDEGTQYRSVILYQNEAQKAAAEKSYRKVSAAGLYPNPIVTQLVPLAKFWPAEKYHQDYYRRNRNKNPYCQTVIAPKLEELRMKLKKAPTPN